jgi:hypothetical protein
MLLSICSDKKIGTAEVHPSDPYYVANHGLPRKGSVSTAALVLDQPSIRSSGLARFALIKLLLSEYRFGQKSWLSSAGLADTPHCMPTLDHDRTFASLFEGLIGPRSNLQSFAPRQMMGKGAKD